MARHASDLAAELERTIARLRAMAKNGVAPGSKTYNAQRGAGCRTSSYFEANGISWSELLRRAGLRQRPSGTAPINRAPTPDAPSVPPEVEAEIRAAFDRGDHLPDYQRDWPLLAIPTRLVVKDIPLPDGSAYRITSAYASIR